MPQLIESSLREKAIKNPKKFLNEYCKRLAENPDIDTHKVNQIAMKDLPEIPLHYFTNYVSPDFKDSSQRKKALEKESHLKQTKIGKIKSITNWLKNQPKDIVDEYYDMIATDPIPNVDAYLKKED